MGGIDIVVAPFHAGDRYIRVGKGPHRLLNDGLIDGLRDTGADIALSEIEPVDAFEGEIGRSFEVMRRVAAAVAKSVSSGRFPLVLAGNCNTTVGTYAGMGDDSIGIVWFDAHADFTTPDEAMGGYFDGMGVATLAGQCWRGLASSVPNFKPLDTSKLLYCGIRDFEPGQREKVEAYGMRAIYGGTERMSSFPDTLAAALPSIPRRILVHLDLDCLDISVGRANEYAAAGGLSTDDLIACINRLTLYKEPVALTIASFNPDLPGSGAISAAAIRAAQALVCCQS